MIFHYNNNSQTSSKPLKTFSQSSKFIKPSLNIKFACIEPQETIQGPNSVPTKIKNFSKKKSRKMLKFEFELDYIHNEFQPSIMEEVDLESSNDFVPVLFHNPFQSEENSSSDTSEISMIEFTKDPITYQEEETYTFNGSLATDNTLIC